MACCMGVIKPVSVSYAHGSTDHKRERSRQKECLYYPPFDKQFSLIDVRRIFLPNLTYSHQHSRTLVWVDIF